MPKSLSELREQLSAIEPDERTYEGIGPSDVDSLVRLVDDDEDWLAARAVHALSRIESSQARQSVASAAQSPRTEVRVAAAASAAALPAEDSDEILSKLLDDSQPAVRKFAVKATSTRNAEAIQARVRDMATRDESAGLRRVAQRQAGSFPPS
jgi:HEAT repeat protein